MDSHRANVLAASCLRTPVNPRTKVPAASYEREPSAGAPREVQVDDHDFGPREFHSSAMEYHDQLEALRRAHLRAMSELERMCRKKLDLSGIAAESVPGRARTVPMDGWSHGTLREKTMSAPSAHQPRSDITKSDTDERRLAANDGGSDPVGRWIHRGSSTWPKEQIRDMWKDFSVDEPSPCDRHYLSTEPRSHPPTYQALVRTETRGQRSKKGKQDGWRPRVTVPRPFTMTLREAELKSKRVRSRSEVERENEELRRRIEELSECRREFRAVPVPAHVGLPLYAELRERDEERRRQLRAADRLRLRDSQRPFSFLAREHAKEAQKEQQLREQKKLEDRRGIGFRAKPVPKAVKEAASGERQKEEELYREIKKFMRAREMLLGASSPLSTSANRLAERRARRVDRPDANHRPRIHTRVPDFDASYRRFREQFESRREPRPVTTREPFDLSTARVCSHGGRSTTEPPGSKWHHVHPPSSLCSLSGSQEYLPIQITGAAKKRQDAVRKVLEQRQKAEEEKNTRKEKQIRRERKLQKLIAKRAQANDPHATLAETRPSKLKDFREQDRRRRREYREEMKGVHERVQSRPLLLERVAQTNAKQAAERCYTEILHKCGLSEDFVCSKAPKSQKPEHKSFTVTERSQSHTPPTYSEYQTPDDPGRSDAGSPCDDYPADHEDYEPDVEATPRTANIIDTAEDGDGGHFHADNPDRDHCYSDREKSDPGAGDRTSKESSDEERSTDAVKEEHRGEKRKKRLTKQSRILH